MIDHIGIIVSDIEKSKKFYTPTLAALEYKLLMEFPKEVAESTHIVGFGVPHKPHFFIGLGTPNVPPIHVAFRAANRKQVDDFYQAALAAGGKDNGAPGLRPHYHENYYGAFVLDPDGHNIEAVCHDAV